MLEVGVVQSALRPKGDLPLHFLKARMGTWLRETKQLCYVIIKWITVILARHDRNMKDRDKTANVLVILNSANKTGNTVCACVCVHA